MVTTPHESRSNMEFTKDVYHIKVVMIGEMNVGKTCLAKKFVNASFNTASVASTTGLDINQKKFTMNGKNIHLMVYDTAGMERFRLLPRSYYRVAHAVMLVYDVTNRSSFEKLDEWMKDVEKNGKDNIVKLVVGNKAYETSPRTVSRNEGREYAEKWEAMFIETSANMGIAIEDAFENVVNGALKVKEFWEPPPKTINISTPEEEPAQESQGCCRS